MRKKRNYDNDNEIYVYYFAGLVLCMFCLAILTIVSKIK